ncbi:guanylate kinase [Patescibacteria group bacterium]|nr:MAG: guanylate kinase [Patescibacteria group bacterium]
MGLLVIISSPSGGGKDSVINGLLKIIPNSGRLVTVTSRPPRPGNMEGIDYHFISQKEFKKRLSEKCFFEYNMYSNHYYGTDKHLLNEALAKYDVIFSQIEINGKHNLDKAGVKNLSIFLMPENLNDLRQRIARRGGLTPQQIEERMKIAEKEMKESADYDFRVVNKEGKLDKTIERVKKIILTKMRKKDRMPGT